jgi:hypothetical protein
MALARAVVHPRSVHLLQHRQPLLHVHLLRVAALALAVDQALRLSVGRAAVPRVAVVVAAHLLSTKKKVEKKKAVFASIERFALLKSGSLTTKVK